jgi:hypothetical protein
LRPLPLTLPSRRRGGIERPGSDQDLRINSDGRFLHVKRVIGGYISPILEPNRLKGEKPQ